MKKNSNIDKSINSNNNNKIIKATIVSSITTIIVSLILFTLMSLILFKIGLVPWIVEYLSVFCVLIGGLAGSLFGGKILGEKGLLFGLINGAVVVLLLILFNLIFNNFSLGVNSFIKYLLVLGACTIGGIIGVNKGNKNIYG